MILAVNDIMEAYLGSILLNHRLLNTTAYLCHLNVLGTRIIDLVA